MKLKLCECGCGQPAPIATTTNKRRGVIKGQPRRFIHGHNPVAKRHKFTPEQSSQGGSGKNGYRYSDEHKQRIREAKLASGYRGPGFGKKLSGPASARRRALAIARNHAAHFPNKLGPESANWKGGSEQYQKRLALIRDDFTCQVCGLQDDEITVVDHIKPKALYPELHKTLSNLITLCPNCHARKSIREKKEIFRIKRERKSQCG